MPRRVGDQLSAARARLAEAPGEPPLREAALLIGRVLGATEAEILAHPERILSDEDALRCDEILQRRLAGEPVAYIFGEREFFGRSFLVDPRVLIPRPETEHLVEAALRLAPSNARIADVGTGSGCIGVTLSLERPDLTVVVSDNSPAALAVAKLNRDRLGARVAITAGNLLTALSAGAVDLVVANLPYVADDELAAAPRDVRDFEPHSALLANDQGTALIRDLLSQCIALSPTSQVLLEIGSTQAEAIIAIAAEYHLRLTERLRDYAGLDRDLVFVV